MISEDFPKDVDFVHLIIQDAATGKVQTLAKMNQQAFVQTQKDGFLTLFDPETKKIYLYHNNNNHFKVDYLSADVANNYWLAIGNYAEGANTTSDFPGYPESHIHFINYLKNVIRQRKLQVEEDSSYTKSLFNSGINKIAQKVGEEAVELVIEAKDENEDLFLGEAADLLFHYLVLLEAKDIDLDQVIVRLKKRHQK